MTSRTVRPSWSLTPHQRARRRARETRERRQRVSRLGGMSCGSDLANSHLQRLHTGIGEDDDDDDKGPPSTVGLSDTRQYLGRATCSCRTRMILHLFVPQSPGAGRMTALTTP